MTKKNRKLSLNKETLTNLPDGTLKVIVGAGSSHHMGAGPAKSVCGSCFCTRPVAV